MNSNSKYNDILPNEILVYKRILTDSYDPIKEELISFEKLVYIMNNIIPFPVEAESYYNFKYSNVSETKFLSMLASKYIHFKCKKNNTNVFTINQEDIVYGMKFIQRFFSYNYPIRKRGDEKVILIYPNYPIKKHLLRCILNKDIKNAFYIDDLILTKLIMVTSNFVEYEYGSLTDYELTDIVKGINFPTLVLANIKLYEKDVLHVVESKNGIEISLNVENINKQSSEIFTRDIKRLKIKILNIVNLNQKSSYSIDDFEQ